jgi:hypothetical protein
MMPRIKNIDEVVRLCGFDSLLDVKVQVNPNGLTYTAQDVFDDAIRLTDEELRGLCSEAFAAQKHDETLDIKEQ